MLHIAVYFIHFNCSHDINYLYVNPISHFSYEFESNNIPLPFQTFPTWGQRWDADVTRWHPVPHFRMSPLRPHRSCLELTLQLLLCCVLWSKVSLGIFCALPFLLGSPSPLDIRASAKAHPGFAFY